MLRERSRRHAAEVERDQFEAERDQFKADLAKSGQRVTELQAALDATRQNANFELDKAAQQIISDRAGAREAGYQLGRIAERARVKVSVSAADIDALSEADRKRIIDVAATAAARSTARTAPAQPSATPALDGLSSLANLSNLPLSELGKNYGQREH